MSARERPENADACPRFGKWVRGCRFEERCDLAPADLSAFTNIKGNGVGSFMEKLRRKTYVRDVCIRCGKTIERGASQ